MKRSCATATDYGPCKRPATEYYEIQDRWLCIFHAGVWDRLAIHRPVSIMFGPKGYSDERGTRKLRRQQELRAEERDRL